MHMHMSFWWGTDIGDLFINGLAINGTFAVIFLCISLFILSILSEALKFHKTSLKATTARNQNSASEDTVLLNNTNHRDSLLNEALKAFKDLAFFAFHNILTYGLMLVVMMYNGFIFITVVLGAFTGYLLFGHLSMKNNMENLQVVQTKLIYNARYSRIGEPYSTGTTPIIPHCSTIISEPNQNVSPVMQNLKEDGVIV